MNPLISIIVPVYNLERYIRKSLDSILSQTYDNLEILVVDDGSTDASPAICDAYALKDSRVHVFHIENGGAACARNVALSHMTGEFTAFVDGDDYIAENYIEVLYQGILSHGADISVCCWEDVGEDSRPVPRLNSGQTVYNTAEALEALLYQVDFDSAMWVKLYKASLFEGITFPPGNLYEDIAIIYKVFDRARRVVKLDYTGYFYLIRESGTTLESFRPKKMDLIDVLDEMEQYLLEKYPSLKCGISSRKARGNFHIYLQIPRTKEFRPLRRRIEKNIKSVRKTVLLDPKARRGTKSALLLTYLGFRTFFAAKSLRSLGKK